MTPRSATPSTPSRPEDHIEHLSGEKRHVDRIALFGETGPEGLRKGWPELIDFVERAPAW